MRLAVCKTFFFKENTKCCSQGGRINYAQKQPSRINNALGRKINAERAAVNI